MSKEMTPKDALNQLNNFISREKHIDSERNKTINKCVDTLSQALDYFEQLEKENQELKELIKEYKLFKELANQVIEKFQISNKNLTEENEKHKKVIIWLKNTFEIILDSKVRISDGTDCIQAFPIDLKTNEVIYDLLKELLENGRN